MLQQEIVVRAADRWSVGRAGMQYRDLVPGRLGGRFIASHIRIPTAGLVPDYVHFHKIRFQMIFCRRGAVRLAYEDQGDEFVLAAGDCVLQPPRIRHRVIEALEPLEVIEIGCPAEHETIADHAMTLPTGRLLPDREYGGQRFTRHVAAAAPWLPWFADGLEARDTGISVATRGLAGAWVVRPSGGTPADRSLTHDGEFLFCYVLTGQLRLDLDGAPRVLETDDSVVVPAPSTFRFDGSADLELLVVRLPG
jgi:quercetin dioxygenase-like cupin family protein